MNLDEVESVKAINNHVSVQDRISCQMSFGAKLKNLVSELFGLWTCIKKGKVL